MLAADGRPTIHWKSDTVADVVNIGALPTPSWLLPVKIIQWKTEHSGPQTGTSRTMLHAPEIT